MHDDSSSCYGFQRYRPLGGIETSIWVIDNGSLEETRRTIAGLDGGPHMLFKLYLPENMGIPFAVNCFSQLVAEACDYSGHRPPQYVMLADADAYFKAPIGELLEILDSNHDVAIVSGHDSPEHEALDAFELVVGGRQVVVKRKENERGLCLVMRTDELRVFHPLPHHRNRDVDWELTKWHRYSIAARQRKLVAVDAVVHLGLYDSTWSRNGIVASDAELAAADDILERTGCLTPKRLARREEYLRHRQLALR